MPKPPANDNAQRGAKTIAPRRAGLAVIAAICFLLVTIVLSIVSVPAALLDRSGRSYLWLARLWSRSFLLLFQIRVRVSGTECIQKGEHYVYVANHSSYADIPILIASIPADIRLILRSSLTRIPIWGWALLASPFLIIDRSNATKAQATLKRAVETIGGGASVLLFPEGTRTPDGQMKEFKRGAFRMAFESNAPVMPIAIIGAYDVMSRTDSLPAFGRNVEVRLGKPIRGVAGSAETARQREIGMMKEAEAAVRTLIENRTA